MVLLSPKAAGNGPILWLTNAWGDGRWHDGCMSPTSDWLLPMFPMFLLLVGDHLTGIHMPIVRAHGMKTAERFCSYAILCELLRKKRKLFMSHFLTQCIKPSNSGYSARHIIPAKCPGGTDAVFEPSRAAALAGAFLHFQRATESLKFC